ncbi:MAG: TatD family hydrolase, partial [Patescibacteria group bacterium]
SRETAEEMIKILFENWNEALKNRTVLHCCEASDNLFAFAKENGIYIGIDGDITWSKKKQRFIQSVPLSMLVLETDAPYLTPLALKETEKWNEPKNVAVVAEWVAKIKEISIDEVGKVTNENAQRLFGI